MHRSKFVHQTQVLSAEISRYLCFCNEISRDAFGLEHENGTFPAGLPGIHDVTLVTNTMGEGSSPRWWSRGPCKAEKPTQGAPARAQKPTQGAPARAHLPELVSKFAVLDHHLGLFMPTASAKRGQPRDVWRHTNRTNPNAKARANHAAPRPGGPRAAPDRRRASPGGALTAVPAFASAHRAPAPEHRRRREFAALRASRLRAGEEGGGAGTAAPLPTRAPEGRGMQGDARAAAGR